MDVEGLQQLTLSAPHETRADTGLHSLSVVPCTGTVPFVLHHTRAELFHFHGSFAARAVLYRLLSMSVIPEWQNPGFPLFVHIPCRQLCSRCAVSFYLLWISVGIRHTRVKVFHFARLLVHVHKATIINRHTRRVRYGPNKVFLFAGPS